MPNFSLQPPNLIPQSVTKYPVKPINMEAEDDLGFTQTPGELDGGELAAILRRAWVSEKSAPEVLDYEEDAVEQLLQMVNDQEEQSREQATDTIVHQFIFNVYQ
eukprot:gene16403-30393_t